MTSCSFCLPCMHSPFLCFFVGGCGMPHLCITNPCDLAKASLSPRIWWRQKADLTNQTILCLVIQPKSVQLEAPNPDIWVERHSYFPGNAEEGSLKLWQPGCSYVSTAWLKMERKAEPGGGKRKKQNLIIMFEHLDLGKSTVSFTLGFLSCMSQHINFFNTLPFVYCQLDLVFYLLVVVGGQSFNRQEALHQYNCEWIPF